MKQIEYKITKHSDEEFSDFVYFCSEKGECKIDNVPTNQTKIFVDLLNKYGSEGWEMAQSIFGNGGVMLIWKREM